MNKTAIKNFAIWARNKLIADISYRAGLMGITESGIAKPLPQSTGATEFYDIGTAEPYSISGHQVAQRGQLVEAIRRKERDTDYKTAYHYIMEEVAYTWFNRLIAVRFMEVNDYLPSHIRVLSSETGKLEPDLVTTPFDADLPFTAQEEVALIQMKQDNKLDEAFRLLFIKQCNALNEILPALFEVTGHYTELLLNLSVIDQDGVVWHLVHDIDEADFDVNRGGQVEIIGWLYQYYNTEPKDETFALLKKNVKITKERIPSATQLFTPDWIVRYMVENSLGRIFVQWLVGSGQWSEKERMRKEQEIADKFGWKYYLPEAEQTPEVRAQLTANYSSLTTDFQIEDLKISDPCMGSGHILVYAFDVLMQIYESQGYTQRDAAQSILQNNLYGLDIDERAAQLAYFAVMMKARQYDRRIFSRGIQPHVYAIVESNGLSGQWVNLVGSSQWVVDSDTDHAASLTTNHYSLTTENQMQELFDCMKDAKEYGSILTVPALDFDSLRGVVGSGQWLVSSEAQMTLDAVALEAQRERVLALIDVAEVLAQKYQVVCTNPPYMGSSGMGARLSDFVKNYYPDSKSDLFAVFIERGNSMTVNNGYNCMVTMQSWMFLSSFEKMRVKILASRNITNLMHMENMVLGIAFGTVVTVFQNSYVHGYKGTYNYIKLQDIDDGKPKEFPVTGNRFAQVSTDNFSKIPGSPVAYSIGQATANVFTYDKLETITEPRMGLTTGNNDKYLRLWFEVNCNNIGFGLSREQAKVSGCRWFPYNKGGEYRKWYGNREYVVDWYDDGHEMQTTLHPDGTRIWAHNFNLDYNFKKHLTWNDLTSSNISFRAFEDGFLFDSSAAVAFVADEDYKILLGYLNTKFINYISKILNPTMHFKLGDFAKIPYRRVDRPDIERIVTDNLSLSKTDWDSFETSWDFQRHPLVRNYILEPTVTLKEAFSGPDLKREAALFLDCPCKKTANEYIRKYFESRAKAGVFNLPVSEVDKGDFSERSAHMVSAFLLGRYIQRNLNEIFQSRIGKDNEGGWEFEYLWFLCCLYHDTFNQLEKNEGLHIASVDDIIPQLCGDGNDKYTIYDKEICCVCLPTPTYRRNDVNNYFNYRNGRDHGIIGGYVAFQKLTENYMEARKNNKNKDRFCTNLNGDFSGHTLVWDKQQIDAFARVADAIIVHNIWFASTDMDKKIYKENGLERFIPCKETGKNLSIKHSPLAYLLSLVDTIEPIKWFVKNESGIRETDVFNNITICITHHSIILGKINSHSFDLKKWYDEKMKNMSDWLQGISVSYSEQAGIITIKLPSTSKKSELLKDKFDAWEDECNTRFAQLKANEEELNRIFIDIYGLQDELTPEVEDKDVTVRLADKSRDVKSLLSYAVGCMFGRYSLDVDGLAYAGGEFSEQWVVVSGQYYSRRVVEYYVGQELSRTYSLAEVNGVGGGNLSSGEVSSERGIVFTFGSDEAGRCVNPFQYRRGTSQKFYEGICKLSVDCTGVEGGTGDPAYDLCSPEILDAIASGDGSELVSRGWKDANHLDWKTIHYSLTTNHFSPDADNVIPITDEEYLEDDIISRLCQWLKVVYGEDTLEQNLDFIASALGNKGDTSREIIRNYFLKDFFKDHCQIYQKRPVYWLFDSGKQNGFKALIYLHRYNADTIGNLRIDYLHRMQRVYESESNRMQDTIDHSGNAREVAQATKRKEKLQKQLKECREYDEKISHLALARIELDLDDGVKVNYEKVQTARDGKKYSVLAKI